MRKVVFLLFLLTTYLLFRPIIGDVWYPVHDTTSIARTYLLEKTLNAGQIPAIWAAELNGGQGYPLFHFYAPAFTYLSLLGKTLTGSYFVGIKLILMLTALFGMLGTYVLTRKWGRAAGLVAALSYGLLPYAAVNLYVRGAYAEYLSMALLPWVFYAWREVKDKRKGVVAAGVTALFILSHNLIPLITAPFLLVWIYLNRPSKIKTLVMPVLLTIGLSAFYLIPLVFERGFVQADAIAVTTDYAKHFVAPTQLWNSAWGFGGSDVGVEDGMSFKVGKLSLILAVVAICAIITKRKKELFFPIALAIALFMTTAYSAFVWENLRILPIVQFPWRFLVLVGFFTSILAGYSLSIIKNSVLKSLAASLVVATLAFLNLKLFAPQTVFPANLTNYTSADYLNELPSIIPEYRPRWLDEKSTNFADTVVLPYYYYPTWQVEIDGKKVAKYPSVYGMLAVSNPTDSSNIVAKQSHTMLEKIAAIMSLITLLVMIKLYVKK